MLVEEQFGRAKDILIRRAFGSCVTNRCSSATTRRRRAGSAGGERRAHVLDRDHRARRRVGCRRDQDPRCPGGDGWRLSGGKHFISDGEFSDFFIVSAVTDPAARRGTSRFLVDKGMPGFTIGRDQPMMGLTGTSHLELVFDDALTREHLLGKEGGPASRL
jgi:acyl-CoA dehydrogenase